MARERVLKVKFWIMHIVHKRGVNLGNKDLEWNWRKYWEQKEHPEEVPLMCSQ